MNLLSVAFYEFPQIKRVVFSWEFCCNLTVVGIVSSLKDELLGMKQRVRVVIVEDEKLHEELKAKAVEETLKEYTFVDSTVRILEVFSYDADINSKCGTIMKHFMKI